MALTRDKKEQVVKEVADLLKSSKMTVIAAYQGTPVKEMQELRRKGREKATTFKVVKNRLAIKALGQTDDLKDIPTESLSGMLLYAFNAEDEVAPAQVLAEFAKAQPTIEFVGAISNEGKLLNKEEVTELSKLPSREELIASVMATLSSPLNDTVSGLSGNLHGLLDGIEAKASS